MVISKKSNNSGRKKEFGRLDFDESPMKVFVGYHECNNGVAKILLDLDEVRALADRYGHTKKRRWRF